MSADTPPNHVSATRSSAPAGEVGSHFDFSGARVLITGATRGVGRGVATAFAQAGATVGACARRAVDDLPSDWAFVTADLRDPDAAFAAVDKLVERLGGVDVVVNNAGGSPPADTATASPRFSERIVALNLLSAVYVSQRAYHHMTSGVHPDGPIGKSMINIASVGVIRPAPTIAVYAAAKAGLVNFTRTVGQEWAPEVRVNAITCGMIYTEQSEAHYGGPDRVARIEAGIPVGRMLTPDDIASTCMFLASPQASYISGANVVLDGGGDRPPFLDA